MVYRTRPLADRFWEKVAKGPPDECWPWTGSRTQRGYGLLGTTRATHVSLEVAGFPRPNGSIALHGCDNPICVNPNHLRWGSDADNVEDMIERKRHHAQRRTHCVQGHPLSGDNLFTRPDGCRGCLTCRKLHREAWIIRRREANRAKV